MCSCRSFSCEALHLFVASALVQVSNGEIELKSGHEDAKELSRDIAALAAAKVIP